jgi:hypothetical protein
VRPRPGAIQNAVEQGEWQLRNIIVFSVNFIACDPTC